MLSFSNRFVPLYLAFFWLGISPVFADSLAQSDYAAYQKSSFTNPAWDPFVQEGFNALDKPDATTAIEFLRKAATLGCASPLVTFKLALAYEALGSYYSAIQYYELARDGFKTSHKDHRYAREFDENYARALYMMGQTDKALPILEKAASHSQTPWVLKLMVQMSLTQGDLLKAASYYERLLKAPGNNLSPQEMVDVNLSLARAYMNDGSEDAAQAYYERVLEADPNNREAHDFLNQIKKRQSYEKVMKIFENH